MTEFKTISTVADELGWTVATVRYRLSKHPEIQDIRLKQGKHLVRILDTKDIAELAQHENGGNE